MTGAGPASPTLPDADDVHRFWFGEVTTWGECVQRNYQRWFKRGRELDAAVRERFAGLVAAAGRGDRDRWRASPRGALALVLTLDQFPRHLHRGSAHAFALDGRTRAICEVGLDAGLHRHLAAVEQVFFVLPLEHAEDPAAQARCVDFYRALEADNGDPALAAFLAECTRYGEMHRDVIARFGRFPHRNDALGRSSTPEERAYLEEGGDRFGQ